MILTGPRIEEEVADGTITIRPFYEDQVNPNSYDFRLGDTLQVYKNHTLDTHVPNEVDTLVIPESGLTLQPDTLYLGHSVEVMGSDVYVPIIRGKSSTGRVGLFVHITADLFDLGAKGQATLMLHAVQPVVVYPNMRIGQVTFWRVLGEAMLYAGKYQGSVGPQAPQIHMDFQS